MKKIYIFLTTIFLLVISFGCTKEEENIPDQESFSVEQAYPGLTGEIVNFVIDSDTLTCEKIDNKYVYQGDIILTERQLKYSDQTKGAGLPLYVYRWPLGTIYYKINQDFPSPSKVEDAIKEYEDKTPLKFVERTNQPNYIEFIPIENTGIGGYSNLGMIGGRQEIGISKLSNAGTVIHEIGHSIGLIHEHSKSDRDKSVIVNYDNIDPDYKHNFKTTPTQIITLSFDFNSIMLYSCKAFSINGKPTITKLDGSTYIAQRRRLSEDDIATVSAMYKNYIYSNPSINTLAPTNITNRSAIVGYNVISNGGVEITEKGIYWGESIDPEKTGVKYVFSTYGSLGESKRLLTGLKPETTYYLKAYAVNSIGIGYGSQVTFKTLNVPTVLTADIASSSITQTSAIVGGEVVRDGGSPVIERGIYWGLAPNPESTGSKIQIDNGVGVFSYTLSGLESNTTYFVKVFAKNSVGTTLGEVKSFKTLEMDNSGTVMDIEGNIYKTIVIGMQTWMIENLKTVKYKDGTSIPNITSGDNWNLNNFNKGPAYCWYSNNIGYKDLYGALYNWYAVNTGKLCPEGWHVPTDEEWTILENYLISNGFNYDGTTVDNKIAKALSTGTYWYKSTVEGSVGNSDYPNKINSSGFSAIPAGFRSHDGFFYYLGSCSAWWTSTLAESVSLVRPYRRYIYGNDVNINRSYEYPNRGNSVRCIKD